MDQNIKSKRGLYQKASEKPFKISRSKLEMFIKCKRCFYLDRRLGVKHPPGFPFTLNIAVDTLLKREFDSTRGTKKVPALLKEHKINAIPFAHEQLESWRDSLHCGISYHHQETNLTIHGGVDDVWLDPDGWLNIVDYKATSKPEPVTLNAEWQNGYKRQIEIYQWLFRRNKFKVSDLSYFVYCNGKASAPKFDSTLNFEISIIPYVGNDSWVEDAIFQMKSCLESDVIPVAGHNCDYCRYADSIIGVHAIIQKAQTSLNLA